MQDDGLRRILEAIDERISEAERCAGTPSGSEGADNAVWRCAAYQLRELRREVEEIAAAFPGQASGAASDTPTPRGAHTLDSAAKLHE